VRVWLRDGVISEEIDGEVIMIDLGTGVYYSLRGSAVPAWRVLRLGATRDEIVTALAGQYGVQPGEVEAAIDGFLVELQANDLLAPVDSRESNPVASLAEPTTDGPATADGHGTTDSPNGAGAAPLGLFTPPEFERFDDMAHVIQMDPVHDIDPARGWPNVADSR
jgi:hypothetical protein